MEMVFAIREALGSEHFARIMCDSFACRLGGPGYIESVNIFRLGFDPLAFPRIMCGSFFCRIGEPNFIEKAIDVQAVFGSGDEFFKLMSTNVIPCLQTPGFIENMLFWRRKLGARPFITFIRKSAKLVADRRNNARLVEWHNRTRNKFQTFMTGGIGKLLVDDEINQLLENWHGILGNDSFCTIFGNTTIIARIVRTNRFGKLMELYNMSKNTTRDEKSVDLCRLIKQKEKFNTLVPKT